MKGDKMMEKTVKGVKAIGEKMLGDKMKGDKMLGDKMNKKIVKGALRFDTPGVGGRDMGTVGGKWPRTKPHHHHFHLHFIT